MTGTVAVKSVDVRKSFKAICDRAFNGEAIIIARPKNENVVVVSERDFTELMRMRNNAEYLAKLDRSREQAVAGDVVVKSLDELRALE